MTWIEDYWGIFIYIGILLAWIVLDKKNIEFQGPILVRRTNKGLSWLSKTGEKYRKFLRIFGLISIPLALFFLAMLMHSLVLTAIDIITGKLLVPALAPIIPGIKIPGQPFFLPLIPGIIALSTVVFFHEFAHGLVARAEKIKIKSLAFALFLVIPGAGVEIDEERVKKEPLLKRLKVYAVGSISNIAFAFLVILFLSLIFVPISFTTNGVLLVGVKEGFPAENLTVGLVIDKINGAPAQEFITKKVSPGEDVVLETNNGTFSFKAVPDQQDPERGIIGISMLKEIPRTAFILSPGLFFQITPPWYQGSQLAWGLLEYLKWIFALNFGIGLFNLIPIEPLDGGRIFSDVIKKYFPEKSKLIRAGLYSFVLLLILINLIGPFLPIKPS